MNKVKARKTQYKRWHLEVESFDTASNLPNHTGSSKEAYFVEQFTNTYLEYSKQDSITACEFDFPNFGRADFIRIPWNPGSLPRKASRDSLTQHLRKRPLTAFEAKLKDWRRALQQAFRYRYFADKAIVVMPLDSVNPAIQHIHLFEKLEIGLWGLDESASKIKKIYTPTKTRAMIKEARLGALERITANIKLC